MSGRRGPLVGEANTQRISPGFIKAVHFMQQRAVLQWLIIGGLFLGLYGEIWQQWIIDLWNDPNYSHGLLIPLVSLYFLRERLPDFGTVQATKYSPGVALVVVALLLYVIGHVGAESFVKRLSFVLLLYGSILVLEGPEIAKILRFPVAILIFAIPLPYIVYDAAAFPLKSIASQISVFFFGLLGLPVFREGNIITLTHTTLEVVDACSGIRSLMTLLTLAFFLGYFQHTSLWRRSVVLVSAVPVAVLANAGRVTMTGVLTKYDPAWGEGTLHEATGWLVFLIAFVALTAMSAMLHIKKGNIRSG